MDRDVAHAASPTSRFRVQSMSLIDRRYFLALALMCGAATAWAEMPPDVQVRLHYSPAFSSQIARTPADPDGKYSSEKADLANKVEFELILFRYFGVSAARIPFYRHFIDNDGQRVDEHAEEVMYSATLYATESRHNSWNVFIGTGWGEIAEYRIKVDGEREDKGPLHRHMPLRRNFIGAEYTFDRLGVRLEANQISADKSSGGEKAELEQQFVFLTFYIPFN